MEAHAYSISANLRWFAVAYVIALALVAGVIIALSEANIRLPGGLSTGFNIGMFLILVGLAGQRFAKKNDFGWTRADRHNLAIGYVATSFVMSLAVFGLFLAFLMALGLSMADMLTGAPPEEAIVIVGAIALIAAIAALGYYAVARVLLGAMAKQTAARA